MGIYLKTERLVLRRFSEDDFPDYCAYAMDPELCRMMGTYMLPDTDTAWESFSWLMTNEERFYALEYREEGRVIGHLIVNAPPDYVQNRPEVAGKKGWSLSFCLAPPYRRRGLMSEALRAVIDRLFGEEGADYVNCGSFPFNTASRRLQEKLGFTFLTSVVFEQYGEEVTGIAHILWRPEDGKVFL